MFLISGLFKNKHLSIFHAHIELFGPAVSCSLFMPHFELSFNQIYKKKKKRKEKKKGRREGKWQVNNNKYIKKIINK